jgi:hypothetical protein
MASPQYTHLHRSHHKLAAQSPAAQELPQARQQQVPVPLHGLAWRAVHASLKEDACLARRKTANGFVARFCPALPGSPPPSLSCPP